MISFILPILKHYYHKAQMLYPFLYYPFTSSSLFEFAFYSFFSCCSRGSVLCTRDVNMLVFLLYDRKRLDATLQDLEEKQNSKKEAVSIISSPGLL